MQININNKIIGDNAPIYVVAEIGFNHGGDKKLAVRMIEGAAEAGANAVKFQTFKANKLILKREEHFEVIKNAELSYEDYKDIAAIVKSNGLDFFSTPFDIESVKKIENIGTSLYKIASMDITNFPLLKYIAKIGKPVILSTGMAVLSEISEAIDIIRDQGLEEIVLLHCISKYPTPIHEANLTNISYLKNTFSLPVGYSDHVFGNIAALTAGILGACVIEKHFTIDKKLPGPDHEISCDITELRQLIKNLNEARQCIGKIISTKRPDRINAKSFRRGIYSNKFIPKGTKLNENMIKLVRPENELSPKYFDIVINREAKRDIYEEEDIRFENI
ncbi:pseudaminic acid synthase [Candidatus Magnetomorum sp. HK-1]|nr:pseudaminic acid synthase [Candidatus Magnetomorum sp. HK-1]